jgi:cytochrome b561
MRRDRDWGASAQRAEANVATLPPAVNDGRDRLAGERPAAPPYPRWTIVVHWLTAAGVALLWLAGQTLGLLPSGPPRTGVRSAHIVAGAAVAVLLVVRATWGWYAARRPVALAGDSATSAEHLAHVGLRATLAVTLALGLAVAWLRGDPLLIALSIHAPAAGGAALRTFMTGLHGAAANFLVLVVGLHAAAALIAHFVRRDGCLGRMSLAGRTPGADRGAGAP